MGVWEKEEGKWILPDGREVLPKAMALRVLQAMHGKTHWGTQALIDQFAIKDMCIGVYNLAKQVTSRCLTCLKVNKQQQRERVMGGQSWFTDPFLTYRWISQLPKIGRYKYLLVIVDHLTHYVEAFPTARATAHDVVKIILEEVIPRYGILVAVDSDQGPHFTSKVTKDIFNTLRIQWKHHTPWHPQSSGRVERMNGEIKKQLTKLCHG